MKASTIYDVARYAGVSHQTVTRVLRGYEGIRPSTRARVETALVELDYRPNVAARMLRTQRTNRIGVLADRVDQTGPAMILSGASELARERGYVLDVVVTDGTSAESVAASMAMLTEHQVGGILATAQTDVVLEELQKLSSTIPLVIGAQPSGDITHPTTNVIAGSCAAQHLYDIGHRRVGYVSGPDLWLAARGRRSGFVDRFTELGGDVVWVWEGDWSPESGYQAWIGLGEASKAVTAIGAANDSMALGLIAAAADAGVAVPAELSVIGNDDLPEARFVRPALTTVAMDFGTEGRELLAALIAEIEGQPSGDPLQATRPHLVVRQSTRAL